MAVEKFERWVCVPKAFPQPENPEVTLADVGVVEQHDRTVRELGLPSFEIVFDVLVEVTAVDMQQIDGAVAEVRKCSIEGRAHKA